MLDLLRRRGHPVRTGVAMAGDVSRRRYFRLALARDGTAVLALYPPDLEETCRRFLRAGELLAGAGVRVPEVFDQDCGAGWALLEDLGERTLYELEDRPWTELGAYFEEAVRTLGRIASLPPATVASLNPTLDRDLLSRELRQTRELFLVPLRLDGGRDGESPLRRELETALETVCTRLGDESPVPCHRDFGARNLVPLGSGFELGVLDHQDLRMGPPAYDLASLLNDSLFPPPDVAERLLALAGVGTGAGVGSSTGGGTGAGPGSRAASGAGRPDRESYHRAAAQRTLKAIGSYAAFAGRGSGRHLRLIPPTLARALDHLRRLPETAKLAPRLEELWAPTLAGQGLDRLLRS